MYQGKLFPQCVLRDSDVLLIFPYIRRRNFPCLNCRKVFKSKSITCYCFYRILRRDYKGTFIHSMNVDHLRLLDYSNLMQTFRRGTYNTKVSSLENYVLKHEFTNILLVLFFIFTPQQMTLRLKFTLVQKVYHSINCPSFFKNSSTHSFFYSNNLLIPGVKVKKRF